MSETAFIGLGSNVGDRLGYLRAAVRAMEALGRVEAASRVYETAPVGFTEQGPFFNAVVRLVTTLAPLALLTGLKQIEADLGRRPGPRFGPREIDLDVLLQGERREDGPPALPHPEMHRRAFVLRPLLDLAPDLQVPGRGPVRDLLAAAGEQGIALTPHRLDAP